MIKRILCKDNFEVWHKYNRMEAEEDDGRGEEKQRCIL